MNDGRFPIDAIGRVGMVAFLKHISGAEPSCMVVLRQPAGWVISLVGSDRPVFAWLAMVLGSPVVVNGKPARDIYVPDRCLIPVSSVPGADVQALVRSQTAQDFDDAKVDLLKVRNAKDFEAEEFDQFLEKALWQTLLGKALETVAIPIALRELGFKPTQSDGETLRWTGVHAGVELRIDAGADMFGVWELRARCATEREAMCEDLRLTPEAPRGQIFKTILSLWRAAFRGAPVPGCMDLGCIYEQYLADMHKANPGPLILHADGPVFRTIVGWLRGGYYQAGKPCEVRLSFADNMLRIEADGRVFGCPAHGRWQEDCSIDLASLVKLPRGALGRRHIEIWHAHDALKVNYNSCEICRPWT